jgi:zinc and cadmium transporter
MTLLAIFLATLSGGVLSVLLAASLSISWLSRFADRMVAFAVGVMLCTALTNLIPEALESGLDPHEAGFAVLVGMLVFFGLEKVALWRHDHGHRHAGKAPHSPQRAAPQVALIVIGDGLHNLVDGILIAAAFLTDPALGWGTALAVLAHEIPQELGDFLVMLDAGLSRQRALTLNALSGLTMPLGGLIGYLGLIRLEPLIPYVLALSAASFLYIAVADLIPELHQHRTAKNGWVQITLLLLGVTTVTLIGMTLPHAH